MSMARAPDSTYAVFNELKRAAGGTRLVTCSDLARDAKIHLMNVAPRLDEIHARLREKHPGLPWLVVIAVRKDTRLPGEGLFKNEAFALDLGEPSQKVWWRAMVAAVFATDWSGVELP